MEQFELRFLDQKNEIVLVRRILARDDGAAMAEAHMGSLSHTLEVWKEERLVGRIERSRSRTAVAR